MNTFLTAAGVTAVAVVAVSFIDLAVGILITLVSDVFGALRRSRKGSRP